ncbi:MAG: type II and III secretion system protein family protein [Planctomyces sp.]|jgi:pilus assembly protein CpaC|nr:pilus assembly protein N-terminal domain-containing protein [Planctomyces sp.]
MQLQKFITVLLLTAGLFAHAEASAQTSRSSPVYETRAGANEVTLIERFSLFIKHNCRIRRVMDFDDEVLTVQPVEEHPEQIRVYALKAGVTSLTIVDENDAVIEVEVLVRGDVRHLDSVIRRLYPDDAISIEAINENSVRLDGWVSRPEHVAEIEAIAQQHYDEVLNHMQTGGVQQIMLKCTVMEVQRSKLRRLGMNFSMVRPDGYLASSPGPITPVSALSIGSGGATIGHNNLTNSTVTWGLTRPNGVFQGFVQAMLDEGIFRTHATPMILTHNGRPATFLSGGEVPIPVAGGLGTSGVTYREFGIQLNTVPYILGNGRVRLEVETKISDQDFSNIVTINGNATSSFRTNSANTQVEMNFGEVLVIAGLVSRRSFGTTNKVPFFGEIPWIGAAFSSKSHTDSESELIILVTPELVAPMSADQVPKIGPGMSSVAPVDRELFFHGLLEVPATGQTCDDCQKHQTAAGQCRNPECVNCEGGINCVQSPTVEGVRPEPESASRATAGAAPKAAPRQQSAVKPASSPNRTTDRRTPARRASDTSGRSGLISPALR